MSRRCQTNISHINPYLTTSLAPTPTPADVLKIDNDRIKSHDGRIAAYTIEQEKMKFTSEKEALLNNERIQRDQIEHREGKVMDAKDKQYAIDKAAVDYAIYTRCHEDVVKQRAADRVMREKLEADRIEAEIRADAEADQEQQKLAILTMQNIEGKLASQKVERNVKRTQHLISMLRTLHVHALAQKATIKVRNDSQVSVRTQWEALQKGFKAFMEDTGETPNDSYKLLVSEMNKLLSGDNHKPEANDVMLAWLSVLKQDHDKAVGTRPLTEIEANDISNVKPPVGWIESARSLVWGGAATPVAGAAYANPYLV